jgi:hypothetical protein
MLIAPEVVWMVVFRLFDLEVALEWSGLTLEKESFSSPFYRNGHLLSKKGFFTYEGGRLEHTYAKNHN